MVTRRGRPQRNKSLEETPLRGGEAGTLRNGQSCLQLVPGTGHADAGARGTAERGEESPRGQAGTQPLGTKAPAYQGIAGRREPFPSTKWPPALSTQRW